MRNKTSAEPRTAGRADPGFLAASSNSVCVSGMQVLASALASSLKYKLDKCLYVKLREHSSCHPFTLTADNGFARG